MSDRRAEAPILLALFLMTLASTSQVLIVSPLLPRIGEELSVPEGLRGTLITSYGLAAGLAALVAGPVSDRVGRRGILLAGTAWMAVALWLHAVAWDYASLLVVRALAGLGGGVLGGVAVAYVGDYFPYERRGFANGVVMTGFALGQVVGIPLGAVLAAKAGFRSPFLVFAVLMTFAVVLTWARVPQPPVALAAELSFASAARKYVRLLARVPTLVATASYLLMFVGVGLYLSYLPTFLEDVLRFDPIRVAGMFVVGGLAAVVVNPLAGRLSDRTGRRTMILASCALFSVVAAVTPMLVHDLPSAYAVFFFAMAAASMRIPAIQSLVSALVGSDERGSLMSLSSAFGQSGMAIGASLAGALYARSGLAACTSAASASVVAMAVMVALGLPEPQGQAQAEAA